MSEHEHTGGTPEEARPTPQQRTDREDESPAPGSARQGRTDHRQEQTGDTEPAPGGGE